MARTDVPFAEAPLSVAAVGSYGGRHSRGARRLVASGSSGVLLLLLLSLIAYPVFRLVYGSVTTQTPDQISTDPSHLTTHFFSAILSSQVFLKSVADTFSGVAVALIIAMLLALFFAWLVARSDIEPKGFIEAAATLPLFVSPLVAAIAWFTIGSPNAGLINVLARAIGLPFSVQLTSLPGLIAVLGIYYAPYAYLLIVPALRNMDPTLEEASTICGASPGRTARHISLPVVIYPLLSAVILVAVTMLSLYAIPAILGEPGRIQFITTYLWRLLAAQADPDYQRGAVVAVLLMVLTMAGVYLQTRVVGSRSFVTITGRSFKPRPFRTGRWKYPILAFCGLYILVAVIVPYFAIIQISLRQFMFIDSVGSMFDAGAMSLTNFRALLATGGASRSIGNSLIVGLATAVIGTALSFILAYVIHRTRLPGRRVINQISMLPAAIPGIIIGVGFLWAWVALPIYGTIWIIIAAFVARGLPDGIRACDGTLVQIHGELEEGAWIAGAGFWRSLRDIVFPLVRPGLGSSFMLLFIFAVREIGAALFLWNTSSIVMSVQILNMWNGGSTGGAAALALVQSAILLAVHLISRRAFRFSVALA